MLLEDCFQFDLPKILDPRGNLSFLEENKQVQFPIKELIGFMLCHVEK